jgi:hypothetical protein
LLGGCAGSASSPTVLVTDPPPWHEVASRISFQWRVTLFLPCTSAGSPCSHQWHDPLCAASAIFCVLVSAHLMAVSNRRATRACCSTAPCTLRLDEWSSLQRLFRAACSGLASAVPSADTVWNCNKLAHQNDDLFACRVRGHLELCNGSSNALIG